ncbi:MAG: HAMP domain-containing methyl-accepting chemotaxis protein [Candidatus Neomarinimicrobiota bacterium]
MNVIIQFAVTNIVIGLIITGLIYLKFRRGVFSRNVIPLVPGIVCVVMTGFVTGYLQFNVLALAIGAPIAIFAVLGGVYISYRQVVFPIQNLNNLVRSINDTNDLNKSMEFDRQDEIGELVQGINIFIKQLHSIISSVKESANQVAGAAQDISASSEQLATGSEEQQSQTSEVATSIEEMAATILESSNHINNASSLAKNATDVATNGGDIVQQAVSGMERISCSVQSSAQLIGKLGQQSKEIGQIISVIDDIADQTNLLALNANIEAARAGDQGRGFAVVADEVRVLAERTTKATAEIAEMIKGIQNGTSSAVTAMKDGIKEVEVGVDLVGKSGNVLSEIIDVVKKVDGVFSQVAVMVEQQSSGAEEISANVEGISTVTKHSARSAQQMASAAQQLSREADALTVLVNQFTL